MNVSLKKDYYLRISDFDRYGRILPSSVLDIFQDIAASHANDLGIGFDDMKLNNSLWVLIKVKYEIFKNPKSYETVHVNTWPLKPDKISFRREYHITNSNGDTLVKGSSEWVVIHSQTRKIMPAADAFPIKDGFITEEMFSNKLKKISDIPLNEHPYITKTTFTDCDINGHVNNIKYANFVLDAIELSEDKSIKGFQVDYIQELASGSEISIHISENENEITAKGIGEDGKKKFACHIYV